MASTTRTNPHDRGRPQEPREAASLRPHGDDEHASERPPARQRRGRPKRGPRSLVAMASAVVAANSDALGADHIAALSERQRAALKKVLQKSRDLSLPLWRLLLPAQSHGLPPAPPAPPGSHTAPTGGSQRPPQLFCSQTRSPTGQLGPYIASLTAPSTEFIVHIRILACRSASFGRSELVKLATLPNLGVLEMNEILDCPGEHWEPPVPDDGPGTNAPLYGAPHVTDQLLRSWGLAKPEPFPALRVMRLWGCCSARLTQLSLTHASAFPLLAHLDIAVEVYAAADDARKPPPTGYGGPRGAWTEVRRFAEASNWIPHSYGKGSFQHSYELPGPTNTAAGTDDAMASPAVSLNMVEQDSVPYRSMLWGACLYSFLADNGYDSTKGPVHQQPGMGVARRLITKDFALLSLGTDRVLKSRSGEGAARNRWAFCFVRTREALTRRAATKRQRERAQPTAAAAAAAEAEDEDGDGTSRPLMPPTKRRLRGSVGVGELLGQYANGA